ncbi:cofilin-2-like [Protopterus annectens]|uniref:cofilin-2-like n=1 Tax=Protopterus annectens TaxID=7888 RepID=UPI001CFA9E38|nr:cofilin-2-like [Protopterus annectens]
MASGVTVADDVVKEYNDMKIMGRQDPKRRKKALFMHLSADFKQIEIDHTRALYMENCDGDKDIFKQLPDMVNCKEPCYILIDVCFAVGECKKQELVLLSWIPDTSAVKMKLIYSSSKDALVKKLPGTRHMWACSSTEELKDYVYLGEKLGATEIEGKPLCSRKT